MPRFVQAESKQINGKIYKQCGNCDRFLPLSYFGQRITGYLGVRSACKECEQAYRDSKKEHNKEYYKSRVLTKFGLDKDSYAELVKKGCEICGSIDILHIDHNHNTGKFRGILCINCNTGLGSFFDNSDLLLKAASYLESRKEKVNVSTE